MACFITFYPHFILHRQWCYYMILGFVTICRVIVGRYKDTNRTSNKEKVSIFVCDTPLKHILPFSNLGRRSRKKYNFAQYHKNMYDRQCNNNLHVAFDRVTMDF